MAEVKNINITVEVCVCAIMLMFTNWWKVFLFVFYSLVTVTLLYTVK